MSSLKFFTKRNALNATTQSSPTTNFNHLRNIPRAWLIRRSKHDPKLKSVRPSDRIKWWNITPGDQVRLRGDRDNFIREVLSINKLSNRVFLKNTAEETPSNDSQPPKTKNYHYSRCQLYVGEFEVPPPRDPGGPLTFQHVFASRIGTSNPRWDYRLHRYVWKRYAITTVPRLHPAEQQRIEIPWPKAPERKFPEAGQYDTPAEEVSEITYRLPSFEISPTQPPPAWPKEEEYLDHIYNPHLKSAYDPSAPYEVYLQPDLANPHSRAKKLERWKAYQAGVQSLLKEITAHELSNLDGRDVKQARSDAAFKWREIVKQEQAKKKKARWMHSAQMAKWQKKNANKSKKEERQLRRLTDLTLEKEPNQVIPKSLKNKRMRPWHVPA